MKFAKIITLTSILFSGAIAFLPNSIQPANAHSVCGLAGEQASFQTKSYLITICLGEASYQMILTFHDGTGYQRIPAEKEGNMFRGSNDKNNFIIDPTQLVIGTDGEPPIREKVTKSS